jgi:hypothetical protein
MGGCAEGGVMVEAGPGSALEVIEPHLAFEILIIPLDTPSELGRPHQLTDRGRRGQ